MDVLSFLFGLLGKWYVWLPIAAVLGYFAYQNNQRAKVVRELEHTLLIIELPKSSDRKQAAAEQLFAGLHGILRSKQELAAQGGLQEHISFEIASSGKSVRFYVWLPKYLQDFVEGQITAHYPEAHLYIAPEDYADRKLPQQVAYSAEMTLTGNEVLPIRTYESLETDPLTALTTTLTKLPGDNEEMWVQVLVRPVTDDWQRKTERYVEMAKQGGKAGAAASIGYHVAAGVVEAFFRPPQSSSAQTTAEPTERDKLRISEAQKKSTKPAFQVKIRVLCLADTPQTARSHMHSLEGTFKLFTNSDINSFRMSKPTFSLDGLAQYRARFFIDKGYILNSEELASVFHLPYSEIIESAPIITTEDTVAAMQPTPSRLPVTTGQDSNSDISAFGLAQEGEFARQFGLYRSDRGRHVYIIGQTGTGKSALLELLALSDTYHGQGYAIIDPHGDLATSNLRFIPAHRLNDVIYFNPADTAHPIGFNPMEVINPAMKSTVSSEIIGVLKRMFADSWGPRLEYILRFTLLALLDYPNTTLLDITRMLTDKTFREKVLKHVDDAVVRQFWLVEFAGWNDRFAAEAIAPVLNKIGAFTANPIIRNIIGQPKSTFNLRQIMDEGKILIVNLNKGLIGEDNAAVLGAFMVTKMQLAAMSRSDIPRLEDRRPFYLYVDEFQNFATDSFAAILSEARKYGLNLTVANQYVSQMTPSVRDAVFGNVGTVISFRVSPDDAPLLAKQLKPHFQSTDLMQLHNRHFAISMVIRGEKAPAFTATSLTLPQPFSDASQHIIANTRHFYARPRTSVEADIQKVLQNNHTIKSHYKRPHTSGGGGQHKPTSSVWTKPSTPAQPVHPHPPQNNPNHQSSSFRIR